MLTAGKVLQETYVVTRLIGEGGMGEVYEVEHLRLDRRFAIKVLIKKAAADPVALARFQREAKITSGLGHPHIVEIVDFNVAQDGRPYLVMELLEGESLADRMARQGRMPLDQIAPILRQTTSALHAAHQKGVIHRDLKPENIFLCRRGIRDDYVKLLDFGISKVIGSDSGLTNAESLVGSPAYMAPEVVRHGSAGTDARVDVYSTGVVLFEMLAGAVPFEADSIYNLLYKIVDEDPPSLGAMYPDVPPDVEGVVARALRKNPDQRHPTMEAMWQDFAAAMEDLDVQHTELIQVHHTAWPEHGAAGASPVEVPQQQQAAGRGTPRQDSADEGAITTVTDRSAWRRRRMAHRVLVVIAVATAVLLAGIVLILVIWPFGDHRVFRGVTVAPDAAQRQRTQPGPPAVAPVAQPDASLPDSRAPDARPADTSVPDRAAPDAAADRRSAVLVRPGKLLVGTLPAAADVYLDGRKVGQSPLVLSRVRPGRHRLVVQRGELRKTMWVTVRAGQKHRISIRLK